MDKATSRSPRFHALDVWRGVVCLLVVLEHAGVALWHAAGQGAGLDGWLRRAIVWGLELNLGTPLFFVMSGYCIASCIDSARRKGTAPVMFLARRLWRIFPPYWAALLGFVLVVAGLDAVGLPHYHAGGVSLEIVSPRKLDAWQWFGNLSLTETWRRFLGGPELHVYTRMAWSLCYQEQFYLVCFVMLLLAPVRFHKALAWATAAIVAVRVVAADAGALFRIDGTFPVKWHEFAVGLAVYARLGLPTAPATRRAIEGLLVALALLGLGSHGVSTAGAALFGLLLIGLHRWDHRLPGLRRLDPVRACGRRSYSIYLTHLPPVMLVNAWLANRGVDGFWPRALVMVPAATVAALAVGWAFHRLVERHFLDLPALPSWRPRLVPAVASALEGLAARAARPVLRPAGGRAAAVVVLIVAPAVLVGGGARLVASVPGLAARPTPRLGDWAGERGGWLKQHDAGVGRAVLAGARVVFLGDSITYNWGDDAREDRGARAWREAFAPLGAVNLGISGDSTQHLLWRIHHGALRSRPRVAVVLIGTNNLGSGQSPEATARGIGAVVAAIRDRSPETRVLLLGVLPRHPWPDHPWREKVARVNALIAHLDDGARVRFLDLGRSFLREDGRIPQHLTTDFLHLSPEGYAVWARALSGPLRRLLDTADPTGGSGAIATAPPARRSPAPGA